MKRYSMITLILCVALMLASPAMALDTEFSGYLLARGYYNHRMDMQAASAADSWMESKFRLKTAFKISDDLKITTRFDALEKAWGTGDAGAVTGANNIDFDQAYMTINTPYGIFEIGRMSGELFGTLFLDNDTERDRIKYTYPMGNTTLIAYYEKKVEGDGGGAAGSLAQGDADVDSYNLAAVTRMPMGVAGVLLNYEKDQTNAWLTGDATYDGFGYARTDYSINPFIDFNFGKITLAAEVMYAQGEISDIYNTTTQAGLTEIDISRFAANVEVGTSALGSYTLMGGIAFMSGDENGNADDEQSWFNGGIGGDWEKLWILTGDTDAAAPTMGGVASGNGGNLVYGNGSTNVGAGTYGAKILYVGVSISPMENLTVGMIFGSSRAEAAPVGWSDDHGMEWDLSVNYEFMGNLEYSFIAAFLAPGDFWQAGNPALDIDNTYSIYNELKLKF